jgi:TonB family protein
MNSVGCRVGASLQPELFRGHDDPRPTRTTIVASAVQTRHSTASPWASSSTRPGAGAQISPMKNPIVHEVPVMAAGVRPGESGGQRRLFTEEASTVLAFENGAVIRLSAAVAVGQLLVLTNKGTKREVVAHVKRKRDCRPTSCYVEVEFSELSAGFWGIEFPEMPELAPANALQREAAEFVHEAEAIADEPKALARAPSADEVTALKHEVEALRAQLTKLKQKVSASGALRIGLLSLALVLVAAGAAWYPHRLSWQPKFSARAASSIAVPPAASSAAQKAVDAHSNSSTAIPASAAAAARPSAALHDRAQSTPARGAGRSTLAVPVAPAPADAVADAAMVPEKSAVGTFAAKLPMRRPSSEAASESKAPSLDEAPIVPPKLIKSVRAVAPPDALRDFVTGNVTLDAVVDPAGLVKSMKVLSGPASFHTGAMDALKQYRYEPATQLGKPVAAHITVTIKFWFEP